MESKEFEKATERDDFAVGDSFWLGNWEFEVINRRLADGQMCSDKSVFKWELSRNDFIDAIRESYPEIEDPEGFFEKNEDDIITYFARGFDILVGGCGATYRTLINDAVDEAMKLCKSEGCGKWNLV